MAFFRASAAISCSSASVSTQATIVLTAKENAPAQPSTREGRQSGAALRHKPAAQAANPNSTTDKS
jgi:hypothetical protein